MTAPVNSAAGEEGWVTAHVGPKGFRADLKMRNHDLIVDEPVSAGGTDEGPTPYEYLLSALGSCTAMTLRFYADRKGWPLEDVRVDLRTSRSHEKDCEDCEKAKVGVTRIDRKIELSGPLTDEQRQKLLQIADRCPVKQTFEGGIRVETVS